MSDLKEIPWGWEAVWDQAALKPGPTRVAGWDEVPTQTPSFAQMQARLARHEEPVAPGWHTHTDNDGNTFSHTHHAGEPGVVGSSQEYEQPYRRIKRAVIGGVAYYQGGCAHWRVKLGVPCRLCQAVAARERWEQELSAALATVGQTPQEAIRHKLTQESPLAAAVERLESLELAEAGRELARFVADLNSWRGTVNYVPGSPIDAAVRQLLGQDRR